MDEQAAMVRPPAQLAAEITEVRRDSDRSYDVAVVGVSHGPSDPVFDRYAQAGVAWWLEHIGGWRASYPELLARLTAGPPVAR